MQAEASASSPDDELVQWVNAYPQGVSFSTWVMPLVSGAITLLFGAKVAIDVSEGTVTPLRVVFSVSFAMSWWFLTAATLTSFSHANRRANTFTMPEPGRAVLTTRAVSEPLLLGAASFACMATTGCVTWFEDPFSDLPWKTGQFRASLMPYFGIILAVITLALLAARPWRRRLILTPHALEYRRFGGPVTIPWDTIEELTPQDRGFMKALIVRAHPPAVVPHLDRKKHPDGTTSGTIAIQAMTVDPGTIAYALTRLWREPESRQLLQTPTGTDTLFTGPTWRERIHMTPGQTWSPPQSLSGT